MSGFPKAFVSSAGILNLPITSLPVDNFHDPALWCKSTGINYNMHGWILCRYCATGWFWWISGLRAVTMWSSSSFTKKKKPFTLTFRICINTPSGSSSRECCIPAQDCFKGSRLAAVAEPRAPQVATIEQSKVEKAISIRDSATLWATTEAPAEPE